MIVKTLAKYTLNFSLSVTKNVAATNSSDGASGMSTSVYVLS